MVDKHRFANALGHAARQAAKDRAAACTTEPGQEVGLVASPSGLPEAAMLHGFSFSDQDGTWTDGASCSVDLRLRQVHPGGRYTVYVKALPFEMAGHRALVRITGDGGRTHCVLPNGAGWVTIPVAVEVDHEARPPKARLEISIANPASPAELGVGEDSRQLGAKIHSLRVEGDGSAAAADAARTSEASAVHPVPGIARRPLWRVWLIDRNPLARPLKWMRRVSYTLARIEAHAEATRHEQERSVNSVRSDVAVFGEKVRAELQAEVHALHDQLRAATEASDREHARMFGELVGRAGTVLATIGEQADRLAELEQRSITQVRDVETALDQVMREQGERIMNLERQYSHMLDQMQVKLDGHSRRDEELWLPMLGETHAKLDAAHGSLQESHNETLSRIQRQSTRIEALEEQILAQFGDITRKLEPLVNAAGKDRLEEILYLLAAAHTKLDTLHTSAMILTDLTATAQTKLDAAHVMAESMRSVELAANEKLDELSKMGRAPLVLAADGRWIIRTQFGFFSCDQSDDLLALCLADSGDVERGVRLLLTRLLRTGDVFVDVGANIGLHTVVAASAVGDAGRVFAIEAMPRTLQHLHASIRLSGVSDRVRIIPVAAGRARAQGGLYVSGVSGHSSLFPLESGNGMVEVDIAPIDEFISGHVDLVKVDVEGAELDAIAGMNSLLSANREAAVIAEFAPAHLKRAGTDVSSWREMIARHGFDVFAIDDLDGRCTALSDIGETMERESTNLLLARPATRIWEKVARHV